MSPKKAPKGPPPPITPVGSGTYRVQPPQKPETPEQFDRKGSIEYYWPRWRVAKQYAASPQESRSLTLALEYVNNFGTTGREFDRIFQLVPTDGSPPPQ